MEKNIGQSDRVIRIVAGLLLLALGVILQSWWGLVGLVPLVTGAHGWCPAYSIFGFSTRKRAPVA